MVGADGVVWSIPKRGTISAEDVSFGSERLTALIEHLPTWQKVRWNHYTAKNKNPLLSPSLDELYGKDKIAEKANLQKFVCVSRSSTGEILEKEASVEDIAFRTMGAAFRVIREMYNNLHNIHALVGAELEDSFPSMERIEKRYCDIIKKALRNMQHSVLEVPLKTNPRAMKEYLSL